ncbi:DUF771 domain-containing protein [Paenibacillus agricola]|uniref:DUF771 domain-containing protein n=1 Tax=Paenibacillus agricola TaxID=2716264 RepID=UPI001FB7E7B9|nr:DUF771 domain-containing protein [Paenibacillus agricola]
MISIQVDEAEVRKMCIQKIDELLKDFDTELVFWDSKELRKRTCMSWNTIQDTFFFDPRFIKRKVGGKWYFSARATRSFLEEWLSEQSRY